MHHSRPNLQRFHRVLGVGALLGLVLGVQNDLAVADEDDAVGLGDGGALDVDEVAPDALDGAGFALVVALDDPDGVVLLDLALLGVEERGVARDVVLFGADEVEVEGAELALLVEDGELLRGELDDDADLGAGDLESVSREVGDGLEKGKNEGLVIHVVIL